MAVTHVSEKAGPTILHSFTMLPLRIMVGRDMPLNPPAAQPPSAPHWPPPPTLTGGSSCFSDLQRTNYPARFYRLCSPCVGRARGALAGGPYRIRRTC